MKTLFSDLSRLLPILLIAGLIACSSAAFDAASDAALLWWSRIVPTLLPYLIAVSLLCRSGLSGRMPRRLLPPALFLFGALGGYPVGAKLASAWYCRGVPDRRLSERAAILCDLPNPVFLLTVVSVGFFRNARCAIPLLIGIYVPSLLVSLLLLRPPLSHAGDPTEGLRSSDLPEAIGEGVCTIGTVGGCIVFASVLYALLQSIGVPSLLHRVTRLDADLTGSVLIGLFEMTCGIRAAAALPFSLPVRLALAAFFAQFGGLSAALQVQAQASTSAVRFLLGKLPVSLLCALTVWLLTPVFLHEPVVPTFASAAQMRANTVSLLSVALSSAIGLLFVFVFTVRSSRTRA